MATFTTHSSASDCPPVTFTLMTYNLWKTKGVATAWKNRRPILLRQLQKLQPDVLFVQELCPAIHECVAEALPSHSFVVDGGVAGWQNEGNVYYRQSMFTEIEHGAENIQQEEEHRRLFWIRLQVIGLGNSTALFSTAHYTWQGHPKEYESDVNLRKVQARNTINALSTLQRDSNEAVFFGGDLNEGFWPKRMLESAGFVDCFSAMGLPCVPTHPNRSSLAHEEVNSDAVLDWLFAKGEHVRPLLASVIKHMCGLSSDDPDERHQLAVVPSDHCPVLSVYRMGTTTLAL